MYSVRVYVCVHVCVSNKIKCSVLHHQAEKREYY